MLRWETPRAWGAPRRATSSWGVGDLVENTRIYGYVHPDSETKNDDEEKALPAGDPGPGHIDP